MKPRAIFAGTVLLLFSAGLGILFYGGYGHTFGADITLGDSARFSESELKSAARTVKDTFRSEFQSCQLQSLTYDEARSDQFKSGYYDTPETIVLFSDYIGIPSPFLDETVAGQQTSWSWFLRQGDDGKWEILTRGYA